MSSDCIHIDKNGPHFLDKNAWWNMISSVYNFLSASTALAQALDQKYKGDMSSYHYIPSKPLSLEGSTEVNLEEYPFFVKLIRGTQELSEVSSNVIEGGHEELQYRSSVTMQPADKHEDWKHNNINDDKIVESVFAGMHQHENFINENFEKRLESIYSEMLKKSKVSPTESCSETSVPSTVYINPTTVVDTQCEILDKFSEDSCFSLYSDSDNALGSDKLPTSSEPLSRPSSCKYLKSSKIGKMAINFTGNTPENFPMTQIEVPPNRTVQDLDNRSMVTWLTASTPYTKQPSQNFDKEPHNTEKMTTNTKEKVNIDKENKVAQVIDELVPKNIEELRRQLAFIRLCREHSNKQELNNNNHIKKFSKAVSNLEQKALKITTQFKSLSSNEPVRMQPKKKVAQSDNFKKTSKNKILAGNNSKIDSLTNLFTTALSSTEKFENNKLAICKQTRYKTSKSRNMEYKKADTMRSAKKSLVTKDNRPSKSEFAQFSSGIKVVNRSLTQSCREKDQTSRIGLVKGSTPTSPKINRRTGKTTEEVKLPKSAKSFISASSTIKKLK